MNVRLIVSIVICIVVVVAGTIFFASNITSSVKTQEAKVPTTPPAVSIKDSFKKGTHTISGTVTLPTACTGMDAAQSVDADGIHIAITTTPSEGICLMRPTDKDFTFKITAPEAATISTTVDGTPVSAE